MSKIPPPPPPGDSSRANNDFFGDLTSPGKARRNKMYVVLRKNEGKLVIQTHGAPIGKGTEIIQVSDIVSVTTAEKDDPKRKDKKVANDLGFDIKLANGKVHSFQAETVDLANQWKMQLTNSSKSPAANQKNVVGKVPRNDKSILNNLVLPAPPPLPKQQQFDGEDHPANNTNFSTPLQINVKNRKNKKNKSDEEAGGRPTKIFDPKNNQLTVVLPEGAPMNTISPSGKRQTTFIHSNRPNTTFINRPTTESALSYEARRRFDAVPRTTILSTNSQPVSRRATDKSKETFDFLYNVVSNTNALVQTLFKEMDSAGLVNLVQNMYKVRAKKGEDLLFQGKPCDEFFIIEDGELYVFELPRVQSTYISIDPRLFDESIANMRNGTALMTRGNNNPTLMSSPKRTFMEMTKLTTSDSSHGTPFPDRATLEGSIAPPKYKQSLRKGDYFGELSLLYPKTDATLTVRANSKCVLWAIDSSQWAQIRKESSMRQRKEKIEFISNNEVFQKVLTSKQLDTLVDSAEYRSYNDGDVILGLGQDCTKIYWVKDGVVAVLNSNQPNAEPIKELTNPSSFGDPGLAQVTVSDLKFVADGPVILLELNISDVEELVGSVKEFLRQKLYGPSALNRNHFANQSGFSDIEEVVANIRLTMNTRLTSPGLGVANFPSRATMLIERDDHRSTVQSIEVLDLKFDDAPAVLPGITFDDLVPVDYLGSGNYGSVHMFLNISTSPFIYQDHNVRKNFSPQFFAVKMMSRAQLVEKQVTQMIDHEKEAMAELSYHAPSNFVVKLFHAFADSKNLYLIMEYCPGDTLYRLFKEGTPDGNIENEEELMFYTASILLGLQAIHSRNIVFRDLKPENLLIDEKGYIKLTDFGMAKKTLRTFTVCGTPDYTAPEVILCRGHGTGVDFWAVGVLVYEVSTGWAPFYGENELEIHTKILEHRPGQYFLPDFVDETQDRRKYSAAIAARDSGSTSYVANDNGNKLVFISKYCRRMMEKFLSKKKTARLGCLPSGFAGIKDHDFFSGFDWDACENMEMLAPISPVASTEDYGLGEYDPEFYKNPDDTSGWRPSVNTVLDATPEYPLNEAYAEDLSVLDI